MYTIWYEVSLEYPFLVACNKLVNNVLSIMLLNSISKWLCSFCTTRTSVASVVSLNLHARGKCTVLYNWFLLFLVVKIWNIKDPNGFNKGKQQKLRKRTTSNGVWNKQGLRKNVREVFKELESRKFYIVVLSETKKGLV